MDPWASNAWADEDFTTDTLPLPSTPPVASSPLPTPPPSATSHDSTEGWGGTTSTWVTPDDADSAGGWEQPEFVASHAPSTIDHTPSWPAPSSTSPPDVVESPATPKQEVAEWGEFDPSVLPSLPTVTLAIPRVPGPSTTDWESGVDGGWGGSTNQELEDEAIEKRLRSAWGTTGQDSEETVPDSNDTKQSTEGDRDVWGESKPASAPAQVKATYRVSQEVIDELQSKARKWAKDAFPVSDSDFLPAGQSCMTLDLTSAMSESGELASLSALLALAPMPETEGTHLSLLFRDSATAKAFKEALDRTASHAAQTAHLTGFSSTWKASMIRNAGQSTTHSRTTSSSQELGMWSGMSNLEIPNVPGREVVEQEAVVESKSWLGGLWCKKVTGHTSPVLMQTNTPASLLVRKSVDSSKPSTPTLIESSTFASRPTTPTLPTPLNQETTTNSVDSSRVSRFFNRFTKPSSDSSSRRESEELNDRDTAFLDAFESGPDVKSGKAKAGYDDFETTKVTNVTEDDFFSLLESSPAPLKPTGLGVTSTTPVSYDAFADLDSLTKSTIPNPSIPVQLRSSSTLTEPSHRNTLNLTTNTTSMYAKSGGSIGSVPLPKSASRLTSSTLPTSVSIQRRCKSVSPIPIITPLPPPPPSSFVPSPSRVRNHFVTESPPLPPLPPPPSTTSNLSLKLSPPPRKPTSSLLPSMNLIASTPTTSNHANGNGPLSKQDLSFFDSLM